METTATTLRWAIVLLANHVSVQERLQTEIDTIIGRQRLPTLDDRSRSVIPRPLLFSIRCGLWIYCFFVRDGGDDDGDDDGDDEIHNNPTRNQQQIEQLEFQ